VHSLPDQDVIDEIASRCSFLYKQSKSIYRFMTARALNPVLRKIIATHGSEAFMALCLINLDSGVSHKAKIE
jgi:hypothetical protein